MKNTGLTVYPYFQRSRILLPCALSTIKAGFPSPADDYMENALDLNELLIRHPAATFFVRVSGDSMKGAGIHSGDLLVVDRAEQAVNGSIIIAVLNGELTVKRFEKRGCEAYLAAENPEWPDIKISPETDFEVWGIVIHSICSFGK